MDQTSDLREQVRAAAERAKAASKVLATVSRAQKDAALSAISEAILASSTEVLAANATDVERARTDGTTDALVDRLTLTPDRLHQIAASVSGVAELPDPVGEVLRGYTLPNGLTVRQLRVPLGVIGMVYEGRPNVTVDAAALCLKSGNAVLLRGSSSARESNAALVTAMRLAIGGAGLPADSVQLVPGDTHESVKHLMAARGLVDVLIPRGGGELIRSVVAESTVPVIETGVGNCHVFVDAAADVSKAIAILVNAKTQRTGVCNAAETLLVHRDIADVFVPMAIDALTDQGVTVHADERIARFCERAGVGYLPVSDDDWAKEYYSLDIAAGVVDSIDDAIAHIRTWSSGHTEAIVSDSVVATQRFCAEVDSAAIIVNASTRFTDGAEFGFGAEIGISTQKLHARGPMGLPELTSTKYIVVGDGHVRA